MASLTATDLHFSGFGLNWGQMHTWANGKVVQGAGDSQTGGGLGTYTFSYTASGNMPDFNNWSTKIVVTNPDGSTDTVYTNFVAEVLLDDHYSPNSGLHTIEAYQYNEIGQLVLDAAPSAVNGYNDSYADLLNDQNGVYQYLNTNSGLITTYNYYTTTTATETAAGGVANYLESEAIQQGQDGTVLYENYCARKNEHIKYFRRYFILYGLSHGGHVFPSAPRPHATQVCLNRVKSLAGAHRERRLLPSDDRCHAATRW